MRGGDCFTAGGLMFTRQGAGGQNLDVAYQGADQVKPTHGLVVGEQNLVKSRYTDIPWAPYYTFTVFRIQLKRISYYVIHDKTTDFEITLLEIIDRIQIDYIDRGIGWRKVTPFQALKYHRVGRPMK